jgi:hypothetical protein
VTIDTSKLRLSTKSALGILVSVGALLQLPEVSAIVNQHPNLEHLAGTLIAMAALLHNPQVEQLLGIKTTTAVTQTTEAVTVAPDTQ